MPVTNIQSTWSSGNLIFKRKVAATAASVIFGVDDSGVDVIFYGDTTARNMTWDSSADKLIITGGSADLGATVEADAYTIAGSAGVDFTSGAITSLEIKKGIITYAA